MNIGAVEANLISCKKVSFNLPRSSLVDSISIFQIFEKRQYSRTGVFLFKQMYAKNFEYNQNFLFYFCIIHKYLSTYDK